MPSSRKRKLPVRFKETVHDLSPDLKRVKRLVSAAKLAGVEDSLSYGLPSLKLAGKFFARVREPDVLVLMCTLADKEMLMDVNPQTYFETDHYKGWPAVLIRLSRIDDEELRHRLEIAWRMQAPKQLVALREGCGGSHSKRAKPATVKRGLESKSLPKSDRKQAIRS